MKKKKKKVWIVTWFAFTATQESTITSSDKKTAKAWYWFINYAFKGDLHYLRKEKKKISDL